MSTTAERLEIFRDAQTKAALGLSYTIDGVTVTRPDPKMLGDCIRDLEAQLAREQAAAAGRDGRIGVRYANFSGCE